MPACVLTITVVESKRLTVQVSKNDSDLNQSCYLQIFAMKAAPADDPCNINHPVVHRLRQCSTAPDLAVDFFTMLLHPCAHERSPVEALMHPYMAHSMLQLAAVQFPGISSQARH